MSISSDQVLGRARVDLAAAPARVDEGAEPDPAEQAGLARGDVAVEVRDAALREVVALDPVLRGELPSCGISPQWPPTTRRSRPSRPSRSSPRPLPSPCPAAKTRVRSRGSAVSRNRRSETGEQRLGNADADEARGADGVPAVDEGERILQRRDLVALLPAADAAFRQPRVGHEHERTVSIRSFLGGQVTRSLLAVGETGLQFVVAAAHRLTRPGARGVHLGVEDQTRSSRLPVGTHVRQPPNDGALCDVRTPRRQRCSRKPSCMHR